MAEPRLVFTRLAGEPGRGGLLVVGPSLGTSVDALWGNAARALGEHLEVVGWDLPGHGASPPATEPFTIAELTAVVRRTGADLLGTDDRQASYAGVSLGGTVALELALTPGDFTDVACIASAAHIGEPAGWYERADLVRRVGTPVMVSGSTQRWFAPGFTERDPSTASRLLHALSDADDESYALACEALASFDLRPRLGGAVLAPLVAPGEHDAVVTPGLAAQTAAATPGARLHVMTGCAHLPPAEDPRAMASVLLHHIEEATHA
jgi:pimeloyl-ACP methyl ester carboxylesterase